MMREKTTPTTKYNTAQHYRPFLFLGGNDRRWIAAYSTKSLNLRIAELAGHCGKRGIKGTEI